MIRRLLLELRRWWLGLSILAWLQWLLAGKIYMILIFLFLLSLQMLISLAFHIWILWFFSLFFRLNLPLRRGGIARSFASTIHFWIVIFLFIEQFIAIRSSSLQYPTCFLAALVIFRYLWFFHKRTRKLSNQVKKYIFLIR